MFLKPFLRTAFRWLCGAIGGGVALDLACAAAATNPPNNAVVIVANAAMPQSRELARYYADARGIPAVDICLLTLPEDESMSRKDYEERLRDPLLEFLRKRKLVDQVRRNPDSIQRNETAWTTLSSSVQYLVLIHGVPLRIQDTRWTLTRVIGDQLKRINEKNAAAVDSELAMLLAGPYAIGGQIANPLFNRHGRDELKSAPGAGLIVARLDGPGAGHVRQMIDESLKAEKYGLLGRAYFDGRGISEGPYYVGDYWIREAYERFKREGFECTLDGAPATWGRSYPMEDVAVYIGWYQASVDGPFLRPDFRFRPGAVACHIHSGSAVSLRTTTDYWTGPLVARGAAATWGAVSEPFLSFMPHVDIFAARLCSARPFGDSVYMSLPALSWQVTVVGDPLFNPFRHTLEEQIRHLEQDGLPDAEWAYLREVNKMVREGRFNTALNYCREKVNATGSLVLRERLADLYARNDLYDDAGRQYEQVIEEARTVETAVRVGARWMLILRLLGDKERADKLEAIIREKWKGSEVLSWLATAQP